MSEIMILEFEANGKKEKMLARNEEMKKLIELALAVKESGENIFLTGESGTGKDLLAKAIHYQSRRKERPFVMVSCSAITETLLESELFGHKKGSYTGAIVTTNGLVKNAEDGTLYLSEITDIPSYIQVKLLGLIDQKEFRMIGSNKIEKAEARIIAATNGDLKKMLEQKTIRQDFYQRLNVLRLNLPPLREHKEDIPILVDYFLQKYSPERQNLTLDAETMMILLDYHWPGNVRELENIIRSLICLLPKEENQISLSLLEKVGFPEVWEDVKPKSLPEKLAEFEKEEIRKALIATGWVQAQAAKILGIGESLLRYKMKKYEIKRPS